MPVRFANSHFYFCAFAGASSGLRRNCFHTFLLVGKVRFTPLPSEIKMPPTLSGDIHLICGLEGTLFEHFYQRLIEYQLLPEILQFGLISKQL
jgi:hypothetical protein